MSYAPKNYTLIVMNFDFRFCSSFFKKNEGLTSFKKTTIEFGISEFYLLRNRKKWAHESPWMQSLFGVHHVHHPFHWKQSKAMVESRHLDFSLLFLSFAIALYASLLLSSVPNLFGLYIGIFAMFKFQAYYVVCCVNVTVYCNIIIIRMQFFVNFCFCFSAALDDTYIILIIIQHSNFVYSKNKKKYWTTLR